MFLLNYDLDIECLHILPKYSFKYANITSGYGVELSFKNKFDVDISGDLIIINDYDIYIFYNCQIKKKIKSKTFNIIVEYEYSSHKKDISKIRQLKINKLINNTIN